MAKGVVSNTLEGAGTRSRFDVSNWRRVVALKFGIEVVALSSSTDFCLSGAAGHKRRLAQKA